VDIERRQEQFTGMQREKMFASNFATRFLPSKIVVELIQKSIHFLLLLLFFTTFEIAGWESSRFEIK